MSNYPKLMDYYNAINRISDHFREILKEEKEKVASEKGKRMEDLRKQFETAMQESKLEYCFDLDVSYIEVGKVFRQHTISEGAFYVSLVPGIEIPIRIDHHIGLNVSKVYSTNCPEARTYLTTFFENYGISYNIV